VRYSPRRGPPPHGGSSRDVTLHFFVPGSVVHGRGDRRSGGTLYAVPRAAAERMSGWTGHAADAAKLGPPKHSTVSTSDDEWFKLAQAVRRGEVPGATSVRFGGSEEVPASDPRREVQEHYRIVRTPGGVAFVRPDAPGANGERVKCGNDGPSDTPGETLTKLGRSLPWGLIAAGGFASLAVLVGGAWLVWRLMRK
jgi:hypothetical protein